jgi:Fic family protein
MKIPSFTITLEINNRIAEIERIKTIVEHSSILPELEISLRYRSTVEAIHSSTTIEGNPLNKNEVEKVIQGQVINAPEYAVVEVTNYKKALDWLTEREQTKKAIGKKDILKLHEITMKSLLPTKKVGRLRSGPVYIVNELEGKESLEYTGPNASKVPKLVDELTTWLDSTEVEKYHPILTAALLHYVFVSIHPFSDGNGRVTRLLTLLYLRQMGYGFRNALVPEVYYMNNRLKYYEALSMGETFEARMQADATPFVDFFTRGFVEVASMLRQDISIGSLVKSTDASLRLSREELQILDYIGQFGAITLRETIDILEKPRRTVQRRLQEMAEKKLIVHK